MGGGRGVAGGKGEGCRTGGMLRMGTHWDVSCFRVLNSGRRSYAPPRECREGKNRETDRRAAFPLRVLYGCRPPDAESVGAHELQAQKNRNADGCGYRCFLGVLTLLAAHCAHARGGCQGQHERPASSTWPGTLAQVRIVHYSGHMAAIHTTEEFDEWFNGLRDQQAKARIAVRVRRLSQGNPGQHRNLENGVAEMKIDYGPGYRVYFITRAGVTYILLCGGDKDSQQRDVANAYALAKQL